MRITNKNIYKYLMLAIILIAVFAFVGIYGEGDIAFAQDLSPTITLVSQSSNDTYARTKTAILTFEDSNPEGGIADVTLDGVSLGGISYYELTVSENGSYTFIATNYANLTSSLTVTFLKVNTTTVTVSSNLGIGVQTGGGEYTPGESFTISTSLVSGYYFIGWSYSGSAEGSFAELNKTMQLSDSSQSTDSYNYIANYASISISSPTPYTYYKGIEHRIFYEPTDGFTSAISYIYNRDADGYWLNQSVSAPILAGTYTATIGIINNTTSETVGQKTITITINRGIIDTLSLPSASFVYDGTAKRLAVSGLLPDGSTARVKSWQNNSLTNAGTITDVSATIAGGNNYYDIILSYGTITVARRTVTITALNKNKPYGYEFTQTKRTTTGIENDPYSFEYYISGGQGLAGGDTLTGCFVLQNPLIETGFTTSILQGTLNNDNNPNYDITFIGATLTATKKTIRILIASQEYEYGEPVTAQINYTLLDSLKTEETLYGNPITSAAQGAPAGNYPFTHSFMVKDNALNDTSHNYILILVSSETELLLPYIEITPRRLIVNALQNQAFIYNGGQQLPLFNLNRPNGATANTLYQNDILTYYIYKNDSLTQSINEGKYILELTSTNYCFYIDGQYSSRSQEILFTILQKEITYINYFNNQDLVYNGTMQKNIIAAAEVHEWDVDFMLSVRYSGNMKDAGSYTYIAYIDYSHIGNRNYYLSNSITENSLIISPKSITVTADNLTRKYGYDQPTLTYTPSEIIEGDSLYGRLDCIAKYDSPIGSYAITLGTLSNPNYQITFIQGTLEIIKEDLILSADDYVRLYYENNPIFTYAVLEGMLLSGTALYGSMHAYDTLTMKNADKFSPCKEYAIGGNLNNPNYNITIITGTLTVLPRPINFVFYNDNLFQSNGLDKKELVSVVSHDILEPLGENINYTLIKSYPNVWISAGNYTFTLSLYGANANNYVWDNNKLFTVKISAARALVTVKDQVITFGDSINNSLYSVVSENTGAVMSVNLTLIAENKDAGDHYGAIGVAQKTAIINSVSYDLVIFKGNLTVLKRQLSLDWDYYTLLTYNGSVLPSPIAALSGGYGDIGVKVTTDAPLIYPGSYTATANFVGKDTKNHYLPYNTKTTVVIAKQPTFITIGGTDNYPVFSATGGNREFLYSVNGEAFTDIPPYCPNGTSTKVIVSVAENEFYQAKTEIFVIDRIRNNDTETTLTNKIIKKPTSYVEINAIGKSTLSDIYSKGGYIASELADNQLPLQNSLAWDSEGVGDRYFVLFYFNVAVADGNMSKASLMGQLNLSIIADWYSNYNTPADLGRSNTNMLFTAVQSIASPTDYYLDFADNSFNNKQSSLTYSPYKVGSWLGVNGYGGILQSSVVYAGNEKNYANGTDTIIHNLPLQGRYFRVYLGIAVTSNSREYNTDYDAVNAGKDNYARIDAGFSNIVIDISKSDFAPYLVGDTLYTKVTADNKYPLNGAKTYSFIIQNDNGINIVEDDVTVTTTKGELTLNNGGLSFITLDNYGYVKKAVTKALTEYTLITNITIKNPLGDDILLTHSHNNNNTHYFDAPNIYNVFCSSPEAASGWVGAPVGLSFYVASANGAPILGVSVNGEEVIGTDGYYTYTLKNSDDFVISAVNIQGQVSYYNGRALFDTELPHINLSDTQYSGVWTLDDLISAITLLSTSSMSRVCYRKTLYGALSESTIWYGLQNIVYKDHTAIIDFLFRTVDGFAQDTVYEFRIVNGVGEDEYFIFNYKADKRDYKITYLEKWHDGSEGGSYSSLIDTNTRLAASGSYTRGTIKELTIKSLNKNNIYYGLQLNMITVTNTAASATISFVSVQDYMEYKSNAFIMQIDNPNIVVGITVTAIFKNYVLYRINDVSKDLGDALPPFSVTAIIGIPEVGTTHYGITTTANISSPMGEYAIFAPVKISASQISYYLDGKLTITARKITISGSVTKVYDKTSIADISLLSLNRILEGDDIYIASAVYEGGQVNAGKHPLVITLGGTDSYKYQLAYPEGESAYYGTITPYGLTAAGGQSSYVFDGSIKHYAPTVSGVLNGDSPPTFTFIYENGAIPIFANQYRAIDCISSNPNYTITSYPEGYHLTITANNTLNANRIITPSGEYRILLVMHNMVSTDFANLPDTQIIYSINGSSYFKIETDRFYANLVGDTVEITYLGKPGMREDLADIYNFQIGVDDDSYYNDSTNFAFTLSALASGQTDNYNSNGTAIYTAAELKDFINGNGNGYLCNNIYDFDWGAGGSVTVFEAGRVLDGNGFTVFLTGNYETNEMTQPLVSFTSFKAWNATGLFVGINKGTIQNINFKYSGIRNYFSDTLNSANSGRAIGFVSGANNGTIRNISIALDGDFSYHSSRGISFGFLAVGGITGIAYENSNIINCSVEHISGTFTFSNHANNTNTYLAFGGAVGFMNGNGNTAKTNGYYNNAALINSKISGNRTNIILDGRFVYGGGLIGCSVDSSNNGYMAGIVDGVINSYSGQITGNTSGYNGKSFKYIGMVGGFISNIYNVYNTYSYTHINLSGLKNVPSRVSVGRDTGYFHIVVSSGSERNPIDWGNFPQNLKASDLPTVRMDTSQTPPVPMGNGFIDFYFEKLNDSNKAGYMQTEIISYFRTFIWDVKGVNGSMIYTITDYIYDIINNDDLENSLLLRWVYTLTPDAPTIMDISFGVRMYGTVDGVVNGYLNYTYNGRNQRENVLESIKLKDESGNIVDGYELIVNAPYLMKDAGTYVVTFVNIVVGTGSGGEGFVFDENSRSIIYISSLDEQSNAIQVVIEKKDAQIANPFPIDLSKEYDGTDFILFSAQFYLEGFTEVLSQGETSPLSIRFRFLQGNINTVKNALVVADLIYAGDPNSIIPYNYNLIGITEFLGSILPRTVTINIPFDTGELPYAYCSKEYDGSYLFIKPVTLNNVFTDLDPLIDVVGIYFDDYESTIGSKMVGDSKVLRFILQNDYYGNYRIVETQESYLTQIYKRKIIITNEVLSKEYDGSFYMNLYQLNSITFDRTIIGDDIKAAIGIYSDKYVGFNKQITFTLGGADSINYELLNRNGTENYMGDILQRQIAVVGNISKVYNKSYAVDIRDVYLYQICDGDIVLLSGIYVNEQYNVCYNHPIQFSLSGIDAGNYALSGNYYGDITPLNITVTGTISKPYDKLDTVDITTLSLSYNLDGSNLYFSGVYDNGQCHAGIGLPVTFSLHGQASQNYSIIGSYYGAITPRKVSVILSGDITKIYDKTSNVKLPNAELAVLDSRNIDGEALSFIGQYANNQINVVKKHSIIFTLTGSAAQNYALEGAYYGSITPKLATVTYSNIHQSYRSPRTDITVQISGGIIGGDIVNAKADMSKVALTHSRYTKYSGITAMLDNVNYYISLDNTTELYFRYFYLAEGEGLIFKIESITDLNMLNSTDFYNDYLTLDYILVNNIDNSNKAFIMINKEYSGSFDGNGKIISGLVLINVSQDSTDANYKRLALFNALAAEGSISNIKVVNTSVNNYDYYTVTAGIVAYNEGTIRNCVFEGEIYAGTITSIHTISGGIAGINLGQIENCISVAVMTAEGVNVYGGGIVGKQENEGFVNDSIGFAEISVQSLAESVAGGVIGQNESSAAQNRNSYLDNEVYINNEVIIKAVGNAETIEGDSYSSLAIINLDLVFIVYQYRISKYAPAEGTDTNPILINNYRQAVLLQQFRWATFIINYPMDGNYDIITENKSAKGVERCV